jgi:hypothetical protein
MIWRKYGCSAGLTEHSFSHCLRRDSSKVRTEGHATRLEAPPIVRPAQHEPLLHDTQHRRLLVRLDHRLSVARKEGAQERDESWDGALLSPDGRRDEEREEGAVLDWYAHV